MRLEVELVDEDFGLGIECADEGVGEEKGLCGFALGRSPDGDYERGDIALEEEE